MLGAAVGEAVAGKKAGNKAALWGAICGTIPDLDVLPGMFMDIVDKNDFHRSVSHSIVFFVLLSPLMGYLIKKIHPNEKATVKDWTILAFLALFTHSLLDCFTTWGTQLFWPHPYKVSFNSIFVIDPLYTLPFMILLIWSLFKNRYDRTRRILNWTGIALSSAYLLLTLINKQIIDRKFERIFEKQGIEYVRYETKPSPFNNILWTTTIETDDAYLIGYYSFFDKDDSVSFQHFPKNHHLLSSVADHPKMNKLLHLTEGWYTVDSLDNTLILNDLRFGTVTAWKPGGQFAFSYGISKDENNELVFVELPKSFEQGKELIVQLVDRVLGCK